MALLTDLLLISHPFHRPTSPRILTMTTPADFLKYIDDNANNFIDRLSVAVSIPR